MMKFLKFWEFFLKNTKQDTEIFPNGSVTICGHRPPRLRILAGDLNNVDSEIVSPGRQNKDVHEENSDEIGYPPSTLFKEMKPLASVMFMNMLWPIQTFDKGRVEASIFNFVGVATLLLFSALLPLHLIVLIHYLNLCWEETESFASLINNITYPTLIHHHVLTPLIAWLPAPSLAAYFNAWTDFQDQWHRSLKRPLSFQRMKKRSFRTALYGIVYPLLVTSVCFVSVTLIRLYQCPTFFMTASFMYLRSASWVDLCAAHEEAANQLGDILCDTLQSNKSDQTVKLRSLRALWLSLRSLSLKLASGAGAIPPLHYTVCLLTICLYNSVLVLMAALSSTGTSVTGAQLLLAFNSLFRVANLHQAGHRASHAVRWSVLRPLLSSRLLDDDIRDGEILSFLSVVDRNPSVITIGDFTDCSRSALVLFYSTFVTYIVVLIQFAYSLSAGDNAVLHG